MTERTVRSKDGIEWSCVPAAIGGAAAGDSADPNTVAVVASPSRAEATARLQLPADWFDKLSDEDLLAAIDAAR